MSANKPKGKNKTKTKIKVLSLLISAVFLLFIAYLRAAFYIFEVIVDESQFDVVIGWLVDLAPFVIGPTLSLIAIIMCVKYMSKPGSNKPKAAIGLVAALIILLFFLLLFLRNSTADYWI